MRAFFSKTKTTVLQRNVFVAPARNAAGKKVKGAPGTPAQKMLLLHQYSDGSRKLEVQYQKLDRSRNRIGGRPV